MPPIAGHLIDSCAPTQSTVAVVRVFDDDDDDSCSLACRSLTPPLEAISIPSPTLARDSRRPTMPKVYSPQPQEQH